MDSNRSVSALLTLFQSIGQSLKELYLWFHQSIRDQSIQFDDILYHFPSIEVFSSRNVHLSALRQPYPHIRRLMIQSIYNPLEEYEIIALLEQLPALCDLQLPRCQSSYPLNIIHQYCPSLRQLTYSMREEAEMIYPDNGRFIKNSGFHTLAIQAGKGFQIHDVAAVLTVYSGTLVDMSLVG